jgi:glycosyltransferase involved in cell wall biosynthesis
LGGGVLRIGFVWTKGGPESWDDRDLEVGIGGSEAMMILYAREFARLGHEVTCFIPREDRKVFVINEVSWRPNWYHYGDLDVMVAVRSPAPLRYVKSPVRAVLANDQSCSDIPKMVDWDFCNLVITISPHQRDRYQAQHPIDPSLYMVSSAGVEWEAYQKQTYSKIEGLCLYASTPERGLVHFKTIWPRILERVPEALLWITGGFELYGWSEADCKKHSAHLYRAVENLHHVNYLGPLKRSHLQRIQQQAQLLLYPSTYDEMCCITALEMAAAGCPIVTTDRAALSERVIDGKTGYLIKGTPGTPEYDYEFVRQAVKLLTLSKLRAKMGVEARRFVEPHSYRNLCQQWLTRFESMMSHG